MIHEIVGCQCQACALARKFGEYYDPIFDAEIEKRVRQRSNPITPLPPAAEEWSTFVDNVRASLKWIAAAVKQITLATLN